MPTGKYYLVEAGRQPGIYTKWSDVKLQVDHFSGAVHRKISREDAIARGFRDGMDKMDLVIYTHQGMEDTEGIKGTEGSKCLGPTMEELLNNVMLTDSVIDEPKKPVVLQSLEWGEENGVDDSPPWN